MRPHVKFEGSELRFEFKGKSGKVVLARQELPGQQLLQYVDEDAFLGGRIPPVGAAA